MIKKKKEYANFANTFNKKEQLAVLSKQYDMSNLNKYSNECFSFMLA